MNKKPLSPRTHHPTEIHHQAAAPAQGQRASCVTSHCLTGFCKPRQSWHSPKHIPFSLMKHQPHFGYFHPKPASKYEASTSRCAQHLKTSLTASCSAPLEKGKLFSSCWLSLGFGPRRMSSPARKPWPC